jgi:hypothetical protein
MTLLVAPRGVLTVLKENINVATNHENYIHCSTYSAIIDGNIQEQTSKRNILYEKEKDDNNDRTKYEGTLSTSKKSKPTNKNFTTNSSSNRLKAAFVSTVLDYNVATNHKNIFPVVQIQQ